MKIFNGFWVVILTAIIIVGCKKETEEPTQAYLQFNLDFNVDGETLQFDREYQINGTTMTFSAVNYYMGGLKLTQVNGEVVDLSSQYLLAGLGVGAVVNEPVAISNISNVQFFVGVDSITNAMTENDFTNRPTGDPLGMQNPSMHWSWSTGYRFLRVDGMTDTDGDGTPETPVEYHLGSNSMLKNINISTNKEIKAGENRVIFGFDLAQFLAGVDLTTELVTHVHDNLPLATKLRDNLPAALTVE